VFLAGGQRRVVIIKKLSHILLIFICRLRITWRWKKGSHKSGNPMKRRTVGLLAFLSSLVLIIVFMIDYNTPSPTQADIAIYAGRGTWDDSVQAIRNMLEWMNCTVETLDAQHINNIGLSAFRVLCVPGGNMYDYAQDITLRGKENIRDFVHNGGGYIGICGGAYFASEEVYWRGSQLSMTPLSLFPGRAAGPIDEIMAYPNYTMTRVNVLNQAHPIITSERDAESMLYYWGPALTPNANANITILGNYDISNQAAMLALEYGHGKVFLIGTHPEIEEDSDRDEVSFGDEFDDHGSEWNFMQKVILWCTEEENP